MKTLITFLFTMVLYGCGESQKVKTEFKPEKKLIITKKVTHKKRLYKIAFDSTKVSKFTIEHSELTKSKAINKRLSDYTSVELQALPEFKRLTLGIVVPFDISKESLSHTMKYITHKKTKEDKDIDELMIFAYDDKEDLTNGAGFYTFGKLFWGPHGKPGNVTPQIARENIRDSYQFEIDIKDKVGNIKKTDLPTKRELAIYNMIMAEENIGMEEGKLNKMVMKKFGLKTEKELNAIWLKVAAYKN
ncbi:hypothetical protein [Zobellia galactanivorans]|uniref:hypothetical protein n=1 Tax=Zobellia galactanivorans (strain DSM 12802 / CCUG 47099 / CIP 106680 / NCIMB 13871 / Dsij) TaxID=63186 RepID=UPI001C06A12F|nr:hypothetical protein [Zobellia galactanivorans]MBU3027594.1 hypothetical protein [Zobellia galactanivorans]